MKKIKILTLAFFTSGIVFFSCEKEDIIVVETIQDFEQVQEADGQDGNTKHSNDCGCDAGNYQTMQTTTYEQGTILCNAAGTQWFCKSNCRWSEVSGKVCTEELPIGYEIEIEEHEDSEAPALPGLGG